VSKLVAYREKDFAFAAAMLESGLIDPKILARRIDQLPEGLDPLVQKRLDPWLRAWVDRH
jgi:threonine dehydrogenase-like Zn-dependent dehydrogenase